MRKYSAKDIFAKINLEEFIKYYITENHTFYETLEYFNFHSDYFLQEYLKLHNISKQDKHYDKVKDAITKERLYQYYNLENHSIKECAEYFNSTIHAIKLLIKDYQIRKEQKDVLKISSRTMLERYGTLSYNNREKAKKTKFEKYGDENYSNNAQRIATIISRYGSVNNSYKLRQEKTVKTNLIKYGCKCALQSAIVKDKTASTVKERYGVCNYTQSNDFKSKTKQTCLDRYGVEYYSQSVDSKEKHNITYRKKVASGISLYDYSVHSRRYTYKDMKFDSSWELALYIYLKDHNIDFEYQPNISFEYTYNNLKHQYYPDFKINDELVEIKSDYLFKRMSDKDFYKYSELENRKYNTMLNNNVKILLSNDMKIYLDYIQDKYGKGYLQRFRNVGEYNVNI